MSLTSSKNLKHHIKQLVIDNVDKQTSTILPIQVIKHPKLIDRESFIASCIDSPLLISVEFSKIINIHNIIIHALHRLRKNKYDQPVMSGFLYKQSRYLKQFKKRWMVLKGKNMYSYKQSNETENPTETFDLSEFKQINIIDNTRFELVSSHNKRIFQMESNNNLTNNHDKWIQTIQKVQNKYTEPAESSICQQSDNIMSQPKRIHVYKTKCANVNVEDVKTMKPEISIYNETQSKSSWNISLHKPVKYLAIYIESNPNHEIYINAVDFLGQEYHHKRSEEAINQIDANIRQLPHEKQYIHDIDVEQNKTELRLLLKILKRILDEPNNQKRKRLNIAAISRKFKQCQICIQLLYEAGFHKCDDDEHLLHDSNRFDKLEIIHKQLSNLLIQSGNIQNKISHSCDINNKLLHQHLDECNSTNVLSNSFQSKKFLTSCEWRSSTEYKCNIDECLCLTDIIKALTEYNRYLNPPSQILHDSKQKPDITNRHNGETIYGQLSNRVNKYNDTDLLNDFNHLLLHHSSNHEEIFNILVNKVHNNQTCNLSNCLLMRRHRRDRAAVTKDESLLQELYPSHDNIVAQQLLDRIHCYYLHSYDSGYRLRDSQIDQIMNETKDNVEDNIHEKTLLSIGNLIKSNKHMHQSQNYIDQKQEKFVTESIHEYSYGWRFFYWKYYRDNRLVEDPAIITAMSCNNRIISNGTNAANPGWDLGDWYVGKKYVNLKDELISNMLYQIAQAQWHILIQKAAVHMNSDKAKQIYCKRKLTAFCYGMKYGDPIKENHLIALLVYCNYDKLQSIFGSTFRMNSGETRIDFKARHSNYHFLSKYLRECVECFGMYNEGKQRITIYRGIDKNFLFTSMHAFVKGPFSTTTSYAVAVNFCNNTGMILEMEINTSIWRFNVFDNLQTGWDEYTEFQMNCFDMRWVSDYPGEQEIFCIGGLGRFDFVSIIEATKGNNYQKYVLGLKQLTTDWNHGYGGLALDYFESTQHTQSESQMVYRLLSHQIWKHYPKHKQAHEFKLCPEYVKSLLEAHCQNVERILIQKKNCIQYYLFTHDDGSINLNLLAAVFPKHKFISYDAQTQDISFLGRDDTYKTILSFLRNSSNLTLKLINIQIDPSFQEKISKFVEEYIAAFAAIGWKISVGKTGVEELFGSELQNFSQVVKTFKKPNVEVIPPYGWRFDSHGNLVAATALEICAFDGC